MILKRKNTAKCFECINQMGFLILDESSDSSFANRSNNDRLGFSYYSELTYFSNDLHKVHFAKSMTSYFATAQNIYFQALIIEKDTIWTNKPGFLTISHKEKDREKLKYYQQLATAMNLPESSRFIMKSPAPYGLSPAYKNLFREQVSNAGMDVVNPLTNNVLQFASFLTGTVRSEILKKTISPIKLGLNEYLKQQLAISSLSVGAIKEGKFKVIAA